MDERLSVEYGNLDELCQVKQDTPHSDLKSLDSSLESLTVKRVESPKSRNNKQINLDASDTEDIEHDRGIKRGISISTISSTDSRDRSPTPKPNKRLSSVLVNPNHFKKNKIEQDIQRNAILESQKNDKQVFDRNKRMFGMLMGTLQRFKTEETHRERSTLKRSKVEEKLDMAVDEEKTSISNEVIRILELKRNKEELLDKTGEKLDVVSRFKNWENTNSHLCSYIQTETKPKIFWLPKEHNVYSERRLKETKDYFSLCVAERAAKFRKELDELNSDSEARMDKPDA